MEICQLPMFQHLERAERILIAGAGGGFDVFSGVPLFLALKAQGKEVQLASLSFSNLAAVDGPELFPGVKEVTADSDGNQAYFPERYLCEGLASQGISASVICFNPTGVRPLTETYRLLVDHLKADALLLVDGGTDVLMRGDEAGLGSPAEDIASLAAAAAQEVPRKIVVCLGFGIDAYHGICHAQYLENVAALARAGGFLGAFSMLGEMPEVQGYLAALEHVHDRMPEAPSIVHSSVASAIEGRYGDYHRVHRTAGSKLWINPLMSLYWTFDLEAVARRVLYLEQIRDTEEIIEVTIRIEAFRKGLPEIKDREPIPV